MGGRKRGVSPRQCFAAAFHFDHSRFSGGLGTSRNSYLALSFLLLLKRLETPNEWIWFGFAYFLEFVLPTFDFFPWSYGRLIAPLIILWLMWRATKKQSPSRFFAAFNDWLNKLPVLEI